MVVCNDATVKGGTYYPMTVKKHLRAQEIALQNRLPCIYLVDSGGANLPHQTEVFPDREHFGRIFFNQARMSAAGIPQIACVMGSCTAGGAYVPAMSDETVIVKGQGTIFLGGPPLVKAATGEIVSAEELGGAEVHARRSGVADHYALDDRHALAHGAAASSANLGACARTLASPIGEAVEPLHPASELDACRAGRPAPAVRCARDHRAPRRRLGFLRVQGALRRDARRPALPRSTGCASASSPITASSSPKSALKGAHFIELCCQRKIPLLFLQNITGFMVGKPTTRRAASPRTGPSSSPPSPAPPCRRSRSSSAAPTAPAITACAAAPSRPRFLFTWPNARISVMGGEQAASVLATIRRDNVEAEGETWTAEEEEAFKAPVRERYEAEGNPLYATARLWDDGIMLPSETRDVLGLALRRACTRRWRRRGSGCSGCDGSSESSSRHRRHS